jgi:hypothetical protein
MGACLSASAPLELIQKTNGDGEAYRKRFQGASCLCVVCAICHRRGLCLDEFSHHGALCFF